MRRPRLILLLLTATFLAIVTSWLGWVRPVPVDMAIYAPADSILYLEANQPLEVIETLAHTDAWQLFERTRETPRGVPGNRWLQSFMRWTGIGPIESVVLARAQVAAVVTDLGTVEEGDTLSIKPEVAVLIETHTSAGRIRVPFENALKALAERTYGHPHPRQFTLDGVDFIEWTAPKGSRQIIGTIIGSLAIIGNSQHAVQNCVAVSLRRRRSLKQDDPELSRMRLQLGEGDFLTFGYVPSNNSARLLAVGLPLMVGRAPADSQFQRLVTTGAAKLFGSLGWTSRAYRSGIEDRYLISLQPAIASRLEPNFGHHNVNSQMQHLLPDDVYSVTSYKLANPAATWQSLKTTISSQVDVLSTIVFSSLLKSSLLSYGINDSDAFLGAVNGELLTLRLDENSERSILIGHVPDRATLRELITKKLGFTKPVDHFDQMETFEDPQSEFAARLIGELIVVGPSADVRRYDAIKLTGTKVNPEKLKRITFFAPSSTSANIVTYTDDANRVRSFMSAIIAAIGASGVTSRQIEEVIAGLPFSVTETTLDDRGVERVTRSPLGQFSTVLPLLVPEQLTAAKTVTESK